MNDKTPIILAVDDTIENLDILVGLLDQYDVRDVTDAASALKILEQTPVDLILLDIMMPGVDGFELCRILQNNPRTRAVPIIFLSAITDQHAIEQAFEIGGKDYVTKPFRPRELLARVKTQLDLKSMVERLQFLAFHDSLTGIYNRRRFFDLATTLFAEQSNLYAILLDIDHFKKINDGYGHGVGDEVLRQVTGAIANQLPPEVVFGRIGGEEFAIVMSSDDTDAVLRAMEIIRTVVADLAIPAPANPIHCTISCGIARRDAGTRNIDELINSADQALYQAKGTGRNRVIVRNLPNR